MKRLLRLLIANSNAMDRKRIRRVLENSGGFIISESESGMDAIEKLRNQPIDVLVTDISIGELDGWRLSRLVRSGVLKAQATIPILMVSRTSSERIAQVTAREFEVNRFLTFNELGMLPEKIKAILEGDANAEKPSLLVIEDFSDTVTLVERMLNHRFEIEAATDGESGLAAWMLGKHDLVLLDSMLPKLSGRDVLKKILDVKQSQAVVIMTAHEPDECAGEFILDGAVDFIPKPFRAEQLRRVCNIAVHREDYIVSNLQYTQRLNQLRTKEEQYRRLVEALRKEHFFYTLDDRGEYIYISPSIDNVLGYTVAEFSSFYASTLSDSSINRKAARLRKASLAGIQQPPFEFEMSHKDGTVHLLEVTESPIINADGIVIAVDGIAHDITDRIQLQKQLRQAQKMEAIGQLTGGIAHDFNNILGSILGYAGLAQRKYAADGEGKLAEYLEEIVRAGERARDLISQMLAYSRGSGVTPRPQALMPLVRDSIGMLRSTIPTSIELTVEYADNLPNVKVDAVQLQQLILNLCINARDALDNGPGKIKIRLSLRRDLTEICSSCHHSVNGDFVELSVSDDGKGIEKFVSTKVFDPFFTTKDIGKGTGMGLSMVHGIVHEHGGHIRLESIPAQGADFRILFPITADKCDPIAKLQMTAKRAAVNGKIMIVDDDPALTKYLTELLEGYGYEVTAFTDPVKALDLFEKNPDVVDLVVTDQSMPSLTGKCLAIAMFDRRPELPIVLCSGYSETLDDEKMRALNISVYLKKPIDPVELTNAVSVLLSE